MKREQAKLWLTSGLTRRFRLRPTGGLDLVDRQLRVVLVADTPLHEHCFLTGWRIFCVQLVDKAVNFWVLVGRHRRTRTAGCRLDIPFGYVEICWGTYLPSLLHFLLEAPPRDVPAEKRKHEREINPSTSTYVPVIITKNRNILRPKHTCLLSTTYNCREEGQSFQ